MKRLISCLILACAVMMLSPASVSKAADTVTVTEPVSTEETVTDTPASSDESQKQTETGIQYICSEQKEIHITGYEGTPTSLVIPDAIDGLPVTYIAEHAFEQAVFTVVTIPESVATIESGAFSASLKTIQCYKSSAAYTYAKQNALAIILLDPTLNVTSKILNVGKKVTLKVTNALGTVSWKSSNTKVATVSAKGVVTAIKAGSAKITAIDNGHKVVCTITVTNMKLSKTKANLTVGKTFTLKLNQAGTNKITWKSSNKNIASISQKGVVTGKKVGTATITATCRTLAFTCKVTILANEKELYTYDLDVSDLSADTGYIGIKKVTYSGSNLKFTAYAFNNYAKKLAYASSITITLYLNGKQIGQQVYANRTLNVNAHSQKQMTFVMRDKYITKKKIDLRTSKITAKVTVGICSFA